MGQRDSYRDDSRGVVGSYVLMDLEAGGYYNTVASSNAKIKSHKTVS